MAMNKLTNIKHYKKEYVKAFYGRYGKNSGLNPGVMWPRKEELQHLKQYEKAFGHNLEDLIAENRAKKEEAIRNRIAREQEVYKNMQKLPEQFKLFFDKVNEKKREKEQWRQEREALIEEVREILGYRAKPSDERFQQALAQKEEEELKAKRKELRKKRDNSGVEEMLSATKESDPKKD